MLESGPVFLIDAKVLDNEREYTPILKPRNIFKIKNDSFVGRQHLKNS